MSHELLQLLQQAQKVQMTQEQCHEQRISFAYGNTYFENDHITREAVEQQARNLKESDDASNGRKEGQQT